MLQSFDSILVGAKVGYRRVMKGGGGGGGAFLIPVFPPKFD